MISSAHTTLTMDDDLALSLQKQTRLEGPSFKAVVNRVLRAGIAATAEETTPRRRLQVVPRQLNMKAKYDPDQLNQLSDELAAEDFIRKVAQDDLSGH